MSGSVRNRAPNEDSNQPVHPRCLSRVFVVRMKNFATLSIQNASSKDSDRTARVHRLI